MTARQIWLPTLFVSFALVVAAMNGCGDFDATHSYTGVGSLGESQLFNKVQGILQTRCVRCHIPGGSATNLAFASPSAFVSSGLVVPGKPHQSKLIYRLKNFTEGQSGTNNMPSDGSHLSDEDYQALYSWVLDMPSGTSPFECREDSLNLASLEPTNMRRLSTRQFRNTLIDLFSLAINRAQVQTAVDSTLGETPLPSDTGDLFKRENNSFSGNHAQAFFEIADNFSRRILNAHRLELLTGFININPGNCTNPSLNTLTQACRTQWVRNFVSRAYRRPLREPSAGLTLQNGQSVDELSPLLAEFSGASVIDAMDRIVFRVLMSPQFLYRLEDQNLSRPSSQSRDVFTLSSFAIANRLSYRFWNTMPDPVLWRLAESGDLYDDALYSQALNYVISQQNRLNDSLREYFHDWLHLDKTPVFRPNGRFAVVANNINFNANLRQAMIDEVEQFASFTALSGGSFEDLFTSNVSVTRHSDLMRLYGITQAAPTSLTLNNAPRFPVEQRSGILTRAAMLVSGSDLTNPIMRGYHLRRDILCLDLGAAPADALQQFESIEVPHVMSTRDKVDIKTSGASCIGCHRLINPLGFGLSNYNAFGMFTEQEPIFTGNNIDTTVPISAAVDLSALFGPGAQAANAAQLSRFVAGQETTKSCFARKFMSYAFDRSVDVAQDGCRLDRIYNNLDPDSRLIDMVRASGLDLEFRLRKIEGHQ